MGVGQGLVAALDLLNGQQRVKFRFAIFRPHQQVQRRSAADQRAVGQERGGQRGALPRLVLVEVHHALAVHAKSKRAFGPCVRLGRGHADMLQHAVHHRQRFLAVGQERPHLQGKAVAQIAVRIQIACKRFIQARDTRTRAAKRQHQREQERGQRLPPFFHAFHSFSPVLRPSKSPVSSSSVVAKFTCRRMAVAPLRPLI